MGADDVDERKEPVSNPGPEWDASLHGQRRDASGAKWARSSATFRAVLLGGLLAACCVVPAHGQAITNRFSNSFSSDGAAEVTTDPPVAPFENGSPTENGSPKPESQTEPTSDATGDLASTGEEATPADPSEQDADSSHGLLKILTAAGPMAIPIAACSVLLVMFTLERAISLRRRRVIPKHFVKLFLNELEGGKLKPGEALEQCEENLSPIAEVFAAAVKKWNRPSVEVEQAVIDAGEREANGLRRYLRLFNGIATISPLLGLLGTVLGMIQAFNAIAASDAMGKPELLAEGISQALLTTAGGLSVAIPAFIVYMYFSSRVDRLIIEIDSLGQRAAMAIASDVWKGAAKTKKAA